MASRGARSTSAGETYARRTVIKTSGGRSEEEEEEEGRAGRVRGGQPSVRSVNGAQLTVMNRGAGPSSSRPTPIAIYPRGGGSAPGLSPQKTPEEESRSSRREQTADRLAIASEPDCVT